MTSRLPKHLLAAALLLALVSCDSSKSNSTQSTSPASNGPVTLAAPTTVDDGTSMGTAKSNWTNGASATQGKAIGGLNCGVPGPNYSFAHLNIYQNRKLLSLPMDIGVVSPTATMLKGCVYPAHTRDKSGKIRIDTSTLVTLGQFFAIWGQPLSSTNVAGVTDQPIKIYINDGGMLTEYTGDPAALQLLPQREITIVAGSTVSQIPTYIWNNPPPLSPSPLALDLYISIGTPYWPDGDTGSGGQGSPVGSVNCERAMSPNYHVHSHLAIIRHGQMLAIPKNIGITSNCFYELHTHDATGVVHIEPTTFKKFTLGNFFSVWGQPLSTTNVAGIVGEPIVVYINEGGDIWRYQGDPRNIPLVSQRSITVQIGGTINEIPSYVWGSTTQ